MKTKAELPVAPLTSPQGGTVLDWPFESGAAGDFISQVEVRRKTFRRRRRTMARRIATAAACGLLALWAVPWLRDTATVGTTVAQRQTVTLADGSQAELNAQTSLHTDFRYGRRHVRLDRGEAFFAVAKDAAHPFLVETPGGTVRVTGTQFNVRVTEDRRAAVTLVEGRVEVNAQRSTLNAERSSDVSLVPGQQFDSARPELRSLSRMEMENVLAWRRGLFAFDGLTLVEAAARLSAYHGRAVVVAPELAGLQPGGSFPVDDLPAMLRALESALAVKVIANADGSFRIVAR